MSLSRDRRAASTLLLRQFREQGRLDLWMRDVTADLPSAERRRVWSLVYGINRNRTLLSCHLEPLLKRPLSGQDPEIQVALLLGSYELLWQDSVPDRAAVDQAVKLARHLGQHGKTGFVNAVLRNLARGEKPPVLPEREEDPLDWSESVASHPRWLVEAMASRVGRAGAAAWAEANNVEPPLVLRLRDPGDESIVEALGAVRSPLVPGALVFEQRPRSPIPELPGFAEGRWWVQDLGAQAVVELMSLQPGMRVLDACAAPGGKTLAAAAAVGPSGSVVAVDRSAPRLRQVQEAIDRTGFSKTVELRRRDLLDEPWGEGRFDVVLVDAPCSGLGVIRRHPDIRWSRRSEALKVQGARQLSIVDSVVPALAPGGALVYSVCTFVEEETDAVIQRLLELRPELALAPAEQAAPALEPSLLDAGVLRSYPHLHGADAFFAARLVRPTEGSRC